VSNSIVSPAYPLFSREECSSDADPPGQMREVQWDFVAAKKRASMSN
jgi:hypothetical protein